MVAKNKKMADLVVDITEIQGVKWELSELEQVVATVDPSFFNLTTNQEDRLANTAVTILLHLKNESFIPNEGFELISLGTEVVLNVSSLSGLFYALLEIRQSGTNLWHNAFRPLQKERALMIDIGRKFYSQEWLFRLIDFMASVRMNTLQLHFSENEGFRLESETFPEIVSEQFLTKKEIRELIAYAQTRFIQIIPELDSPGHLKRLLTFYPQWRLARVGEYDPYIDHRALDITNPEAVSGIKDLLKEYFDLFKESQYFHLGADEFVEFDKLINYPTLQQAARAKYGAEATGIELYLDYTNDLIEFTQEHGFQARVWNDGFYRLDQPHLVELTKNVQITYWTKWHPQMAPVTDYLARGYEVINYNDNLFYFVLGEAAGYTYPTAEKILAEWTPVNFPQGQVISQEQLSSVIGTSFAIWSDVPEALSEREVYQKITGPLQSLATKSWEIKQIKSK